MITVVDWPLQSSNTAPGATHPIVATATVTREFAYNA